MNKAMLLIIALFPSLVFSSENYTLAMENKNIFVLMNVHCSPCDVVCKRIVYQILDKGSHISTTGHGETLNVGKTQNVKGFYLSGKSHVYSITESHKDNIWDFYIEKNGDITQKEELKTVFNNRTC